MALNTILNINILDTTLCDKVCQWLATGWWFSPVTSFSSIFNNISVISWRSVLLVEETEVTGENHQPVASHWQTLSHNVVSSTPRHKRGSTHNFSGDRHWLHDGPLRCLYDKIVLIYNSAYLLNEKKIITTFIYLHDVTCNY